MILEFTCTGNRQPYYRHRATLKRSAWGRLYLTVESMDAEYRVVRVEMGPLGMWQKRRYPLIEQALRSQIPEELRVELERDLVRPYNTEQEAATGLTPA